MRGRDKFDKSSIEDDMNAILANKYGHMDAGQPKIDMFPYPSDMGTEVDNMEEKAKKQAGSGIGIAPFYEEEKVSLEEYSRRWEAAKAKESSSAPQEKALRYNEGKLPWHLVDFKAFEPMVKVLQYGAQKYAEENWRKGLSLKEIRDSFIRHLVEWNSGQDIDEESKCLHLGHLMCNLMFYSYFTTVNPEKARE